MAAAANPLTLKRAPENFVRLDITDTGIGISAEALPHIFDRFFRADNARAREAAGSGLGLAICQTIVASHNGRLTVESTHGAGSRFSLILPAV